MAHLQLSRTADGDPRVVLNGLDLTHELYVDGLRIRASGSDEFAEMTVELKVGLSRLDLGDIEDVDAALLAANPFATMAAEARD